MCFYSFHFIICMINHLSFRPITLSPFRSFALSLFRSSAPSPLRSFALSPYRTIAPSLPYFYQHHFPHILHPLPNQLLHPRQRLICPSLRMKGHHYLIGKTVFFNGFDDIIRRMKDQPPLLPTAPVAVLYLSGLLSSRPSDDRYRLNKKPHRS